jgi:GAF domain-containing protein
MNTSPEKDALVNCVDEVLITSQLAVRPSRPPDYEAQSQAMLELGDELRVYPDNILHKVAELAMKLCHADSAGISILESEDKREIFRWQAIAGGFAPNLYGSLPRDASPCGTVVARNQVMLFNEPDRYYKELRGVSPRVYESLLAPWPAQGRPEGTLWVVAHTPERHFDAEDARIVQILARFASGAHHAVAELVKAKASQEDLEKRVEESAFLLSDTFKALRKEMEGHDQANSKRRQAERALREIERRERPGE